ncbi:MAG TPA: aminotransferase class V-fold PLP-dependent enzyme [Stellaceae bacterium]|nr:aminotransferase class V-fold PLP-dependent enzyme [Stellaceae bacterium]
MPDRLAYLDHNATTPVHPEVAAAVAAALALGGNPSSVHAAGRAARRAVERARAEVAALIGAEPDDIVFVSGGSEANQLALRGCGRERFIVSAIEHDSVLGAVPEAEILPVTADGVVDRDALARLLAADRRPALVSVMLANNETGVIQPVAELAALAHAHGALLHCDAVQAAGKLPIDWRRLGADLLSLSAHKIGGPQGVGALAVAPHLELRPAQRGGGQEGGRRAGTENVPGIVGFGRAAAIAASAPAENARLAALRDEAERLLRAIAPEARIFGAAAPRLANTLSITMPGVRAETQVMALDLAGVMVSAGAACSSGKVRPSHVLRAMGASAEEAASAIRISFGWSSTPEDVAQLAAAWGALYARAGKGRGEAPAPLPDPPPLAGGVGAPQASAA